MPSALNPQLSFPSCVFFSSCVHAFFPMPLKASSDNSSPLYLSSVELSLYKFVLWLHGPYVIVLLLPLSFPSLSKARLYTIHVGLLVALPPSSPITPQFKLRMLLRPVLSPPRAQSILSYISACYVFPTQVSSDCLRSNAASLPLFLTLASLQSYAIPSESSVHQSRCLRGL